MMAIETSSRRSAVVAPTMNSVNLETIWVFGDQLNRDIGALRLARPDTHQILMVESRAKVASRRWHIQRAHFIVASMRRFADELREEGFSVDYQRADSMRDGVRRHQEMCAPSQISVTEPNSFAARELVSSLDVHVEMSDQFLCHPSLFEEFAGTRKTFKMEDFYRWQRKRLNILMDGDTPAGGQWNFDEENREPPPKTGHDRWPQPVYAQLDEIDAEVMRDVSETTWGAVPDGTWATSRRGALERLDFFVKELLPMFGEHEDAMLQSNWHLAHSLLSPYLNIGLLLPGEVVNAAQEAFRSG
ncbi:MAG: cryptochrome/photolyase family protein, partial [Actinobacteria bacterium]|nr:cryptochrome/photolyase family protein [Actinomycetota bacterium]